MGGGVVAGKGWRAVGLRDPRRRPARTLSGRDVLRRAPPATLRPDGGFRATLRRGIGRPDADARRRLRDVRRPSHGSRADHLAGALAGVDQLRPPRPYHPLLYPPPR